MSEGKTVTQHEVDAMITMRLLAFHEALVERGQIPPAPNCDDAIECDPSTEKCGKAADEGFVLKIEEFSNCFVAHGLMGLVASDTTRDGAIEKLRKLTIRQVDGPNHKSGLLPPAIGFSGKVTKV